MATRQARDSVRSICVRCPQRSSKTKFNFDDWFFLHDDNHMTARASLTKHGIQLGTLIAFCERMSWSATAERSLGRSCLKRRAWRGRPPRFSSADHAFGTASSPL
ncbi:DUF3833 family protein [Rhizobium sp.]